MASLIKNQIVKHLSKFAKNLNPDHISVEVLKGKGELHNIELNEVLITEALELPAWLKIERAICNRVAIKIPWTSLKSQPVTLLIDEIRVDVVMSSNLRDTKPSTSTSSSSYGYDSGYNFANRVAEGMSLNINSLEIFFTSEVFGGSLTLTQFRVASSTPFWKQATDLRQTRIREPILQQVLLFKQITWQLLRIEASTLGDSIATGYNINAPLRLITSQGRARITIKKSNLDGTVLAGRVQIILDDLLWVATLPQVRSAISFYRYLMKLVQSASELRKTQHFDANLSTPQAKVNVVPQQTSSTHQSKPSGAAAHHQHSQQLNQGSSSSSAHLSSIFRQFDVVATSYHFYGGFIDLHICDDSNSDVKYPDNWNFNSGALQVSLSKLVCDFYPYHQTRLDRDYWLFYNDVKCRRWVDGLLKHYFDRFSKTVGDESFERQWSKLFSQCCVVRVDDVTVYCVSEANTGGGKPKKVEKLLCADHEILKLPGNLPLIHAEFGDYYYGVDCSFPLPPSSTFVQINPMRAYVDLKTIRWISYIYLDLCKTLGLDTSSVESVTHSDVRVEALMPRIIFPAPPTSGEECEKHAPTSLIVQISSYSLTNCFVAESSNHSNLVACASYMGRCAIFNRTFEPRSNPESRFRQMPSETEAYRRHSDGKTTQDEVRGRNAFNDVWQFELNPVWIDFTFSKNLNPRPVPFFVDSAVVGWTMFGDKAKNSTVNNADAYCVVQPKAALKFALDHFQYLFLVRTFDEVSKFLILLNDDAKCFYETMEPKSLAVSMLAPLIELSLVLPSTSSIVDLQHSPTENNNLQFVDPTSPSSDSEHGDHSDGGKHVESCADDAATLTGVGENIAEFTGFSMDPDQSFDQPSMSMMADDAISVNTDLSDDDQFVVLDNGEPSMFDEIFPKTKAKADVAEEAYEMSHSNSQHDINLITKNLQRQVSVVLCKLYDAQLTFGAFDQESKITFQSPTVELTEEINVTLEEAYRKINAKSALNQRHLNENGASLDEHQMKVELITENGVDPAYVDSEVKNVRSKISSATLAHLSDFFQNGKVDDTSIESANPVRVKITNTQLNVGGESASDTTRLTLAEGWIFQGNKNWKSVDDNKKAEGVATFENVDSLMRRLQEMEAENAELRQKLADAKTFVQKLAKNNYDVNLM